MINRSNNNSSNCKIYELKVISPHRHRHSLLLHNYCRLLHRFLHNCWLRLLHRYLHNYWLRHRRCGLLLRNCRLLPHYHDVMVISIRIVMVWMMMVMALVVMVMMVVALVVMVMMVVTRPSADPSPIVDIVKPCEFMSRARVTILFLQKDAAIGFCLLLVFLEICLAKIVDMVEDPP
jgi:hypothetical protein